MKCKGVPSLGKIDCYHVVATLRTREQKALSFYVSTRSHAICFVFMLNFPVIKVDIHVFSCQSTSVLKSNASELCQLKVTNFRHKPTRDMNKLSVSVKVTGSSPFQRFKICFQP